MQHRPSTHGSTKLGWILNDAHRREVAKPVFEEERPSKRPLGWDPLAQEDPDEKSEGIQPNYLISIRIRSELSHPAALDGSP